MTDIPLIAGAEVKYLWRGQVWTVQNEFYGDQPLTDAELRSEAEYCESLLEYQGSVLLSVKRLGPVGEV